jgi:hypothetical protein
MARKTGVLTDVLTDESIATLAQTLRVINLEGR